MRSSKIAFLALVVFVCGIHVRGWAQSTPSKPYLLMVTFYDPTSPGRLASFNQSPYDGVAVPVESIYDVGAPPTYDQVHGKFAKLQQETGKDLWPWVFFNRMVGTKGNVPEARKPEFEKIKAMDLDGSSGAQNAFLALWRNSLRQAKGAKVPGIVLDLEFYNNYGAYFVDDIAKERSTPVEQVKNQLRQLGDVLAQIAGEEYPDAQIWVLTTGLAPPSATELRTQGNRSTRSFILRGLMDGARSRHLGLVVVDGGEDSLGYCHPTVTSLREAIRDRGQKYAPLLSAYKGTLQLGGTMVMWQNTATRTDWLAKGDCAISDVQTAADFTPYLKVLLQTYKYVWVYAPGVGGFNPFDADASAPLHRAVGKAKSDVR